MWERGCWLWKENHDPPTAAHPRKIGPAVIGSVSPCRCRRDHYSDGVRARSSTGMGDVLEVPPPRVGLTTVDSGRFVELDRAAGMAAFQFCAAPDGRLAGRSVFRRSTDAATKLVPCTRSWNPGHPAGTEVSKVDASVGVGLAVNGFTVNCTALDGPVARSVSSAVTASDPAVAKSSAVSLATSCVPELSPSFVGSHSPAP